MYSVYHFNSLLGYFEFCRMNTFHSESCFTILSVNKDFQMQYSKIDVHCTRKWFTTLPTVPKPIPTQKDGQLIHGIRLIKQARGLQYRNKMKQ